MRIDQCVLQDGAKRLGPFGISTKRFRKRAQQAGVGFVGLHLDADQSLGGRSTAVRVRRFFLRCGRHDQLCDMIARLYRRCASHVNENAMASEVLYSKMKIA